MLVVMMAWFVVAPVETEALLSPNEHSRYVECHRAVASAAAFCVPPGKLWWLWCDDDVTTPVGYRIAGAFAIDDGVLKLERCARLNFALPARDPGDWQKHDVFLQTREPLETKSGWEQTYYLAEHAYVLRFEPKRVHAEVEEAGVVLAVADAAKDIHALKIDTLPGAQLLPDVDGDSWPELVVQGQSTGYFSDYQEANVERGVVYGLSPDRQARRIGVFSSDSRPVIARGECARIGCDMIEFFEAAMKCYSLCEHDVIPPECRDQNARMGKRARRLAEKYRDNPAALRALEQWEMTGLY